MELFDRTGVYSIDFTPSVGFKIAQSQLEEQAYDRLEGGRSFFAPFRKYTFNFIDDNYNNNNMLVLLRGCGEKHKLMPKLMNRRNAITGSIFIYGK